MSWAINWEIVREETVGSILEFSSLDSGITIASQRSQCHPDQDLTLQFVTAQFVTAEFIRDLRAKNIPAYLWVLVSTPLNQRDFRLRSTSETFDFVQSARLSTSFNQRGLSGVETRLFGSLLSCISLTTKFARQVMRQLIQFAHRRHHRPRPHHPPLIPQVPLDDRVQPLYSTNLQHPIPSENPSDD